MPKKLHLEIQESQEELDKLYRASKTTLTRDRLKMLILILKGKHSSRKSLAIKLGRRENTIGDWVKLYSTKKLSGLLSIKSGGNNTRTISEKAKDFISLKVHDSSTTITSYVELQALIATELEEDITYGALYAHCRSQYKTKLKVFRKSHYNHR